MQYCTLAVVVSIGKHRKAYSLTFTQIVHGISIPLGKLGIYLPRTISAAISSDRASPSRTTPTTSSPASDADTNVNEPETPNSAHALQTHERSLKRKIASAGKENSNDSPVLAKLFSIFRGREAGDANGGSMRSRKNVTTTSDVGEPKDAPPVGRNIIVGQSDRAEEHQSQDDLANDNSGLTPGTEAEDIDGVDSTGERRPRPRSVGPYTDLIGAL